MKPMPEVATGSTMHSTPAVTCSGRYCALLAAVTPGTPASGFGRKWYAPTSSWAEKTRTEASPTQEWKLAMLPMCLGEHAAAVRALASKRLAGRPYLYAGLSGVALALSTTASHVVDEEDMPMFLFILQAIDQKLSEKT